VARSAGGCVHRRYLHIPIIHKIAFHAFAVGYGNQILATVIPALSRNLIRHRHNTPETFIFRFTEAQKTL